MHGVLNRRILGLGRGFFLPENNSLFKLFTGFLREAGGSGLGLGGEFSFEIGLDNQTCHRSCKIGTEAAMLYIDTNGNLGIVHRRKGNEGGVILTGILDGARLAADGIAGFDAGGGAMFDGKAHAFDNRSISLGGHLRLTLREITLILRVLVDMGHIVPPSVCNGDGEVAELQGGAGDITLPHACPPDCLTIPPVLITAVQIVSPCEESALFTRDVDVHWSAQPHRLHIGAPGGDGLIARGIHEVVVDHRGEGGEKPGVARLRQGLLEIQR